MPTPGVSKKKAKESGNLESSHKYTVGDVVMARIKGFPAWPAIIVDGSNVPNDVLNSKPAKKAFFVRFFPVADYNFANAHELSLLTKDDITSALERGKGSGDLKKAYEQAADPVEWNERQNAIVAAAEQDRLRREEDMDQLDGGEDDVVVTSKKKESSKKRKRPAESSDKVRQSADAKRAKNKSADAKAEAGGDDEDDEDNLDPEVKKVKDWRHKLQRSFLPKDDLPLKADDMANMDEMFKVVESHTTMSVTQLRISKIGKVMKRIKLLPAAKIPREDDFHFRERAEKLCDRWAEVLGGAGAGDKTIGNGDESIVVGSNGADSRPPPADASKEGTVAAVATAAAVPAVAAPAELPAESKTEDAITPAPAPSEPVAAASTNGTAAEPAAAAAAAPAQPGI